MGETSGKTTKLWETSQRRPQDHFIFFWLVSAIGVETVQGENQITSQVSFLLCLCLVCENKWLRCLLVSLSLPVPSIHINPALMLSPGLFFFSRYQEHYVTVPAVKRPQTLNTVPPYPSRSDDMMMTVLQSRT